MKTFLERSSVPPSFLSERPINAPRTAPADAGSNAHLAARVAASEIYGHRLDRLRGEPSPPIQRTRVRFGERHADEIDLKGNEREVQGDVRHVVNQLVLRNDGPGLKKLLLGARRHGFGQVESHVADAILNRRRQALPRIPGRERPFKEGLGPTDPPDPRALPVRLHGQSRGALNEAPQGSPLMGIVHLRRNPDQEVSSAKVFVHPSEPNDDFPMPEPNPDAASIYGNPPQPPVTHVNRNVRGASTPSGHEQVADLLLDSRSRKSGVPKFSIPERERLKTEPGHFIGFSVEKSSELLPHRLSYTSATFNPGTFRRNALGQPVLPSAAASSSGLSNPPSSSSRLAGGFGGLGQFLAARQAAGPQASHHPTHYQVTEPWAHAINAQVNAHIDPEQFSIPNVGPGGHEVEDGEGGTLKYTSTPGGIISAWTPRNYQPPQPVVAPRSAPPPRRDRRRPPPLVGGVTFRTVDSIGRRGRRRGRR